MKSSIFLIRLILGGLLMLIAILWILLVYFETWDIVLTAKERFLLSWRQELMLIVGYALACYKNG